MRHHHLRIAAFFSFAYFACLSLVDADSPSRIWTDSKGRQVEAELLDFSSDGVVFRRTGDRKLLEVPIESLSEADQEFIRNAQNANVPGEKVDPPGPAPLPDTTRPSQTSVDFSVLRFITDNFLYFALAALAAIFILIHAWMRYYRKDNTVVLAQAPPTSSPRIRRPLALKLLAYLLFSSAVASFLTAAIIGSTIYHQQVASLQSRLTFIASSAAAHIAGESLVGIRTEADEKTEEYASLKRRLRDIKSRHSDIKFIYTMRKSAKPEILSFVVDAQVAEDLNHNDVIDPEEEPAHVGEMYNTSGTNMLKGFEGAVADDDVVRDKWGSTLSAYAPIKTRNGDVVGIVGIDTDANQVASIGRNAFLLAVFAFVVTFLVTVPLGVHLAVGISRPLKSIRNCLERYAKGDRAVGVSVESQDEIGLVASAVNEMILTVRQRDVYKNALDRYVSSSVADRLLEHPQDMFMRGERRRVTVLFADLRDFTPLSATLSPEDVISILNRYFVVMIEIIFRCGGTLDKFLGDGLMAVFGAPLDLKNHESRAVEAALEIQEAIKKLRLELEIPSLGMGIGVNTGIAVVGSVGSEKRMEYTAIGEEVNLASRLESATRLLNVDILVSEYTYAAIKYDFIVDRFDNVELKGVSTPVTAYAVRGRKPEKAEAAAPGEPLEHGADNADATRIPV